MRWVKKAPHMKKTSNSSPPLKKIAMPSIDGIFNALSTPSEAPPSPLTVILGGVREGVSISWALLWVAPDGSFWDIEEGASVTAPTVFAQIFP